MRALAMAIAACDANSTRVLFVLFCECRVAFLFAEVEVADLYVPVVHRSRLEDGRPPSVCGEAHHLQVARQIRHPQWPGQVSKVIMEPWSVRPFEHSPELVWRKTGGDEVLNLAHVVRGRDHAVVGARKRAGALHDLLQDGVEVQARAYAQNRCSQPGDALLERLVSAPEFVDPVQPSSFSDELHEIATI